MNPTTFTFTQIATILESAKIPCNVKEYKYENDTNTFSVEFGFNWPEHLMEDVDKAFAKAGFHIPSNIDFCGDSCGPNTVAKRKIAGGPKNYFGYNKW